MGEFPKYFRIDVSGPDKEGHVNATITPAADVRSVARGKWYLKERAHYFQCSVCKTLIPSRFGYDGSPRFHNFCPNCGADMREVKADG